MSTKAHHIDKQTLRYKIAVKKLSKFLNHHFFLIIATLAVWCSFYIPIDDWNGSFSDADGYMRALRVYHWLLAPTFAEQPIFESNYPFGEILHWTRPMDIIWIICCLPFIFTYPLKEAIFIGGAFIAPILGILTSLALAYGLKRRFNPYLTIFGCFIFWMSIPQQSLFSPSRPDHHALITLLCTYALSLTLCWLKKRHNRYLRLMGITLALATMTVIDGFLIYTLFIAFFLYLYIFKNIALLPTVKTTKYFAVTLTFLWLLNPPQQDWFYPDNGRISILYVIISWLLYLCLKIMEQSHLHSIKLKFMGLLTLGLGFTLTTITLFGPDVFHFPVAMELDECYTNRIQELQNITNLSFAAIFMYYLIPFLSLILNIYLLKIKFYKRIMLLNLCLGLPLFILSLFATRFTFYQNLYIILPFLTLLDYLYKKSSFAQNKSSEFPAYLWFIMLGIIALEMIAPWPRFFELSKITHPHSFSSALCQQVKQIGGTLATDIFISPRYVWECGVNTIGTPYHRNTEGILDNHKLLHAKKDSEIIPLLLKHQITQILVFNPNSSYYKKALKTDTLYRRLLKKQNIPTYLEEVPTTLTGAHLYRTKI